VVAPGDRQGVKGESPGAAGKAANLGGESPSPSITRFRRLAYLMHVKVTTHVLLRCKRHGCPGHRRRYPAVGTTWVASKLGGLKINEWLQRRNHPSVRKSLNGALWEADPWDFGEGRCDRGSNGYMHPVAHRGKGPSIRGKIGRDNAGKGLCPAGAHNNLQGLWIRANW
jgi:hypothetical protein